MPQTRPNACSSSNVHSVFNAALDAYEKTKTSFSHTPLPPSCSPGTCHSWLALPLPMGASCQRFQQAGIVPQVLIAISRTKHKAIVFPLFTSSRPLNTSHVFSSSASSSSIHSVFNAALDAYEKIKTSFSHTPFPPSYSPRIRHS
jgi:hypothetical protein